jgi:hypothetical protein
MKQLQQKEVRVISSSFVSITKRNASSVTKDLQGQSEFSEECMMLEDKYGAHNYHPVS